MRSNYWHLYTRESGHTRYTFDIREISLSVSKVRPNAAHNFSLYALAAGRKVKEEKYFPLDYPILNSAAPVPFIPISFIFIRILSAACLSSDPNNPEE